MVLSLAAAATSTIELGTIVTIAPALSDAAMSSLVSLNQHCGGRLVVGCRAGDEGSLGALADRLTASRLLIAGATPPQVDLGGWIPLDVPLDAIGLAWRDLGTFGDDKRLIVPAAIALTERDLAADRPAFRGSFDQVVDDLELVRRAGATDVVLGLTGDPSLDDLLATYGALAEALEMSASRPLARS
jgi:alkanesulfonate monooxygenase SsuD/methylene tetrahydromethanopterin reductase-like flavin-dependent oxidoreductase (luciferase family)